MTNSSTFLVNPDFLETFRIWKASNPKHQTLNTIQPMALLHGNTAAAHPDYWLLDLLKRFRRYCLTHAISKKMITVNSKP